MNASIHEFHGDFHIEYFSKHMAQDRLQRYQRSKELEEGNIVKGFLVDRGHVHGPEIHWVLSNGVIVIVNAWTNKFVTLLIARPGQVARYFHQIGEECPHWLIDVCQKHKDRHMNEW